MTATGYVRKYAQWLLNHSEEVLAPPTALRRRYGPEVEEALVLAWKTLNRICAKRLIPFLPSIVESLEEVGHLELDEEQRGLLLSMSAATRIACCRPIAILTPMAFRLLKPGPCSNSRSLFGRSPIGTRPNLASWRWTWWPTVEGEYRVGACTRSR